MGIIQFGFILGGQITVTSAAREGVRSAVVGADNDTVRTRVKEFASVLLLEPLDDTDITIYPLEEENRISGEELEVFVSGRVPIIVPGLGILTGSHFNVASTAVMRVERGQLANVEPVEPEPVEPDEPELQPGDPPRVDGGTISWKSENQQKHIEVFVDIVSFEGPYSVGTLEAQLNGEDETLERIFQETSTPGTYRWAENFFGTTYQGDFTVTFAGVDGSITIWGLN